MKELENLLYNKYIIVIYSSLYQFQINKSIKLTTKNIGNLFLMSFNLKITFYIEIKFIKIKKLII